MAAAVLAYGIGVRPVARVDGKHSKVCERINAHVASEGRKHLYALDSWLN
jgi:hypothetical protein